MPDPRLPGFFFIMLLAASFAGIAVLITRGRAKPGVVMILIFLPFLYYFGMGFIDSGFPHGFDSLSSGLVVGVIASLIAGLILKSMSR